MSAVIAAIIAFTSGIAVALVTGRSASRIDRRGHVAQLASDAFVDAMKAVAYAAQCQAALNEKASGDERSHWRQRYFEARAEFAAAKARLAAYGNGNVGALLARIEHNGGFVGQDTDTQECMAKIVLELRKEQGFKKTSLSEDDVRVVLFGSHELRRPPAPPPPPPQQPQPPDLSPDGRYAPLPTRPRPCSSWTNVTLGSGRPRLFRR